VRWNAFHHILNEAYGAFMGVNVTTFDAQFFSIVLPVAKSMDPQQCLTLAVGYVALI
jgi:acyl transferase domain-containing protein